LSDLSLPDRRTDVAVGRARPPPSRSSHRAGRDCR
jgi:hypothetical protein